MSWRTVGRGAPPSGFSELLLEEAPPCLLEGPPRPPPFFESLSELVKTMKSPSEDPLFLVSFLLLDFDEPDDGAGAGALLVFFPFFAILLFRCAAVMDCYLCIA